ASMDAEGNDLKSTSELARAQGKLVGIVTNAELEDATPAVYSVHNKNRSQGWTKMCQQQIVFGADLFMGNGYSDYSGYFNASNDLYKFVEANNMKLYSSSTAMVSHLSDDAKMWAVFAGTANKFARFDTTDTDKPNLQQMTAYALKWLDEQDKNNNDEKGFVVMIENTYTDHFGHGNQPLDGSANTYGIVKEVQSTDEAVAIALKYVLEHPDTALIVTADHETGNTTLKSGWETDFTRIVADSGSHSAQNVPVFAIGKGTEDLNSLTRTEAERAAGAKWAEATPYQNAIIGHVIGSLLGDDNFGGDVETDTYGKTSPRFDVTVAKDTTTLTFTLDLTGVPFRSGNLIQFKIKPTKADDSVKLELLQSGDKYSTLFDTAKFSTAKKDAELSPAYKQCLVEKSGLAEGWYQFSLPATIGSTQLKVTLTGNFKKDDVIGMDDLTVQYASTIGQILFHSDDASAAGEPLVILK
ncbi:MAG: alkaline phosphatase, partial [Spirochaetales bacterium]|nr:alkaline phosphatase [Spirochaetales bacterium]